MAAQNNETASYRYCSTITVQMVAILGNLGTPACLLGPQTTSHVIVVVSTRTNSEHEQTLPAFSFHGYVSWSAETGPHLKNHEYRHMEYEFLQKRRSTHNEIHGR